MLYLGPLVSAYIFTYVLLIFPKQSQIKPQDKVGTMAKVLY